MFNISNDLAISRARHLKVHKDKLKEIQVKTKGIDNVLNPLFYPAPKRNGFKVMYWTEKVMRENQILLEKLIKIRQKPANFSFCVVEKGKKGLGKVDTPVKAANVEATLSTKNMLKDYSKYKNYIEMRSKFFHRKIQSLKRIEAGVLGLQVRQKSHKIVKIDVNYEDFNDIYKVLRFVMGIGMMGGELGGWIGGFFMVAGFGYFFYEYRMGSFLCV